MGYKSYGIQTRGNPADPRIYPEAASLPDPWPEAHLGKSNYLISNLATDSNIKIAGLYKF